MFGGPGTIVLVIVMRVLVSRAWREGIGLTLLRRLVVPGAALLIGLLALLDGASKVFGTQLVPFIVLAFVVTATAGVVRARTVEYDTVPEAKEYPGGIRIRARRITLQADVVAVLCAAALIYPSIAPDAGMAAAGGSLTVIVALGDIIASGLLVLRGRPQRLPADNRRPGLSTR
ncbi:hypothetical protein GCM10010269_56360 [Streptomyces humidus]|uniref:Uncharacterized protein n=1 Tax=Streptomyces humidus TaxID=52259 RepID=A0A918G1M7_9ACTN|nr:hypothetical protein [Streptomyces humidus]GGS09978.1 hypothetical protein GCM10010269_56360 [Streptomyces humidus]